MRGIQETVRALLAMVALAGAADPARSDDGAGSCTSAVGRIVVVQGGVELRRAVGRAWHAAHHDTALCDGDAVRTGPRGRAVLWISPENLLRLDRNSLVGLTVTAAETRVEFFAAGSVTADPSCGAGYFMSRFPRRFKVRTPTLNASIEGTEFLVQAMCTATTLSVVEGRVAVQNPDGTGTVSVGASEQVTVTPGQPLPVPVRIAPTDAVRWALYYPPLAAVGDGSATPPVTACDALDAVARRQCRFAGVEAALRIGDVATAGATIDRQLAADRDDADAAALKAIVLLARNDKGEALAWAQRATRSAPGSVRAWLALSYVQQARFRLEDALEGARRAADAGPSLALARARVAEVELALGRAREAIRDADAAVAMNPSESRARTVLAFAHLSALDSKRAADNFSRAIQADPADPLPRLGLGLARIREGRLSAGREDLAVAVALDPGSSLLRSYLGKAYAEENTAARDTLAADQFALAKAYDPQDPTPHFYDALLKQVTGQLGASVTEFREAIALNDRRAVYRSTLLLDDDRAVRRVTLARAYRELGFDDAARVDAATSLMLSPASDSAHRNLSESYAAIDRHEVSRVGELLQAQMLQPLALHPVQPSAPFLDLAIPGGGIALPSALNEHSALFDRTGVRFSASVLGGSRQTTGSEVAASVLGGPLYASLGYFRYATDGFRPNSDIEHEVYNAFLQAALTPIVSVQGEFRRRRSDFGDIVMNFEPTVFSADERHRIEHDTGRFGLTVTPSARWRVLASWLENERREVGHYVDPVFTLDQGDRFRGHHGELQAQYLEEGWNVVAGVGRGDVDQRFGSLVSNDLIPLYCATSGATCDVTSTARVEQRNVYAYGNAALGPYLVGTVGASRDEYRVLPNHVQQWSPKFGVVWTPVPQLRVRAANYKALKRDLLAEQSIEPTQVAGFNQVYDDFNGTPTENLAVGVDGWFAPSVRGSAEFVRRDLTVVTAMLAGSPVPPQSLHEASGSAAIQWIASPRTSVALGWRTDTFVSDATISTNWPSLLRTTTVPLTVRHAWNDRFFTKVTAHDVTQKLERSAPALPLASGHEHFQVVDLSFGYRLPQRHGVVSLDVYNLFDRSFRFQDDNFRRSFYRPAAFIPDRSVFVRASLQF